MVTYRFKGRIAKNLNDIFMEKMVKQLANLYYLQMVPVLFLWMIPKYHGNQNVFLVILNGKLDLHVAE